MHIWEHRQAPGSNQYMYSVIELGFLIFHRALHDFDDTTVTTTLTHS